MISKQLFRTFEKINAPSVKRNLLTCRINELGKPITIDSRSVTKSDAQKKIQNKNL